MPELEKRRDHETALANAVIRAWTPFLVSGPEYTQLAAALAAEIKPPLYDVFLSASLGMAPGSGWQGAIPLDAEADAWSEERAIQLADGITATTQSRIDNGWSPEQAMSDARAEVIAATEVTAATTAGEWRTVLAAAAFGILLSPRWYTAEDERVCDICGPLNGAPIEVFGGWAANGPPAHPNCRCFLEWTGPR